VAFHRYHSLVAKNRRRPAQIQVGHWRRHREGSHENGDVPRLVGVVGVAVVVGVDD